MESDGRLIRSYFSVLSMDHRVSNNISPYVCLVNQELMLEVQNISLFLLAQAITQRKKTRNQR